MNVPDLLKRTSRGSLRYDRGPPTKEFLDECASIPKLSSFRSDTRVVLIKDNELDTGKENSKDNTQEKESGKNGSPQRSVPQNKNKNRLIVSPEFGRSLHAIRNYEEELESKAKNNKLEKEKQFKEHTDTLQKEASRQLEEMEQKNIIQAKYKQDEVVKQYQDGMVEMQEKVNKLKEDHRQHAQMLENRRARLQEELRQKERERKERMDAIQKLLTDMITVLQKLSAMYQECEHKNRLPEKAKHAIDLVQHRVSQGQQLMNHTFETGEITAEVINKLREHLKICSNAYDFVKEQIGEVNKIAKEEAETKAKAEAEAQAKAKAEAEKAARPAGPLATSTPMPTSQTSGHSGVTGAAADIQQATLPLADDEVQCVDIEAFNNYTKLQQEIKDVENSYQTLATNAQLKKLKFSFQKAVNTPINAISPVSGEHLRDKLQRLLALLSGQNVEISNKRTSTNEHPEALTFCKHLIAKMIVKKGDEQVSSKHETAFAIAAVAVGVWCDHPDVGKYLIAEFHKICPYIVPYHIPRQEGQSTEEYHKSLGYKYDSDGKVEDQDKFLKRMSGVMRLYAALMVAVPPKGQNHPHPHGIENAWIWLSRVMNIEPLPDITTTMVYDMLQVTGHALSREYRKQFAKLLYILVKEYLPKLNRVASKAGGGPVSRLRTFLEESIKRNGQIAPPEGLLPTNFWFS